MGFVLKVSYYFCDEFSFVLVLWIELRLGFSFVSSGVVVLWLGSVFGVVVFLVVIYVSVVKLMEFVGGFVWWIKFDIVFGVEVGKWVCVGVNICSEVYF